MHRRFWRHRVARLSAGTAARRRAARFTADTASHCRVPRQEHETGSSMNEPTEISWSDATRLANKAVVLTGIASGIGRATAKQFAAAGVTVYGGDINERDGAAAVEEIKRAGGQAHFLPLNLTQAESIDAFVDAVKER